MATIPLLCQCFTSDSTPLNSGHSRSWSGTGTVIGAGFRAGRLLSGRPSPGPEAGPGVRRSGSRGSGVRRRSPWRRGPSERGWEHAERRARAGPQISDVQRPVMAFVAWGWRPAAQWAPMGRVASGMANSATVVTGWWQCEQSRVAVGSSGSRSLGCRAAGRSVGGRLLGAVQLD